jgi:hypothetical protein
MERLKMTIDDQRIFDDIQKLSDAISKLSDLVHILASKLDQHIIENEESSKKVVDMYKILVTGNGVASFQERVRILEAWIKYIKYGLVLLLGGVLTDIGLRLWNLIIGA